MNRSKVLYKEIVQRTQNGELQWRQTDKSAYRLIIRDANRASRIFEATWHRGGQQERLVLVEKNQLTREHVLFPPTKVQSTKLYILERDELQDLVSSADLNWVEMTWLSKNIIYAAQQSSDKFLPVE